LPTYDKTISIAFNFTILCVLNPQKINSKNIYGNKSCILQRWFKKNSCSEVEVTDSEKDQRGFYIKKVIGDGNCLKLLYYNQIHLKRKYFRLCCPNFRTAFVLSHALTTKNKFEEYLRE
jgi:hypothetical protein